VAGLVMDANCHIVALVQVLRDLGVPATVNATAVIRSKRVVYQPVHAMMVGHWIFANVNYARNFRTWNVVETVVVLVIMLVC